MPRKCEHCRRPVGTGHTGWCPNSRTNPDPTKKHAEPQANKRNFKKRPDDGRTPPEKRGR